MSRLKNHFATVAMLHQSILKRTGPDRDAADDPALQADIKRLEKLVAARQFSPAYRAMQKNILDEFIAKLPTLAGYERALRHWPSASTRWKGQFLQDTARLLADIQRTSGIDVLDARVCWRDEKRQPCEALADYDFEDMDGLKDRILLQRSEMHLTYFAEAVNSVVHEQTHIFEAWLARAFLDDALDRLHPLYRDAELATYALGLGYVPSSIRPAYRAQCVERDAFTAGDLAGAFIAAAMANADFQDRRARMAKRTNLRKPAGSSEYSDYAIAA